MEQLLESRADAAKAMNICLRKLEHLIVGKQLKVVRIGSRVLIPRKAIEDFHPAEREINRLNPKPSLVAV